MESWRLLFKLRLDSPAELLCHRAHVALLRSNLFCAIKPIPLCGLISGTCLDGLDLNSIPHPKTLLVDAADVLIRPTNESTHL